MDSGVAIGDMPSFARARFLFSLFPFSFLFLSRHCFSASFRPFFASANWHFAVRTSGSGGSEVYPWSRTPCERGSN